MICSGISFLWKMNCWQPYTPIFTASTFFKNSYIKILINCSISFNLSQGALSRSKYSSGVFSTNFPHSDSLAFALTANLPCSFSMQLIEQGIVSNLLITSLFIYLFTYLFIYLSIYLFIYLFNYLFIYLFIYLFKIISILF